MKRIRQQTLQKLAESVGLSITAITDLAPLTAAVKPLNDWQSQGMAGEMRYMNRSAQQLSSPLSLLPNGKSVVCVALSYSSERTGPLTPGYGRVARYAWGADYHLVLPERLSSLVSLVEAEIGAVVQRRVFSDATPLLERALAARANLGFVGKNTMLIRQGQGSFFFLAEILWDVEISDGLLSSVTGSCGTCQRCIDTCPTKAISAPYVVDARKCISYLSIEKRSALSVQERQALGEWVFGCDICQEVCPFNHAALKVSRLPSESKFAREAGIGPELDLSSVLRLRTNAEHRRRFAGTALLRAKRGQMIRNAACVAANTDAERLMPDLVAALEDTDSLVRQHVVWALGGLVRKGAALPAGQNWEILLKRARQDKDACVREEAVLL